MKRQFTLDDLVIKEALESIRDVSGRLGIPMVVAGGIANQIYNRDFPDYFRPTNDVDLATFPYLEKAVFEETIGPELLKEFNDRGHEGTLHRTRNNYEVRIMLENKPLLVHMDRYSRTYFERIAEGEKKKVADAKRIDFDVPYEIRQIDVVRPEHVINGKHKRLNRFIADGHSTEELRELFKSLENLDFDTLSQQKILPWLTSLVEERDILTVMPTKSPNFQSRLKLYKVQKDTYDVCLMAKSIVTEKVRFDNEYYLNVKSKNGGSKQSTLDVETE